MKKTKGIRKEMKVVLLLLVVLLVVSMVWFFLGKKKYTFYMKEDIGEIHAVRLSVDDYGDEEDRQELFVYDKEIISTILEQLEPIKLKPNYNYMQQINGDSEKGFSIILWGEDKKRCSYSASDHNSHYFVQVISTNNGTVEEGIRDLIELTSITSEEGNRLYDLVKQIIEENICNITVSDLEHFSKEKIYDWNQFQQYIYIDGEDAGVKVRNGLTSIAAARFPIEGKKGYVVVWYYNGIIDDEKGRNEYHEVCDAVVYTEDGEKMNLYDEGIGTFLEEME